MPLLQGLIFDLDGTLIDSAPDLRQALNGTLRSHKRRELSLDEVKSMVGDGMLPLLNKAFAATGVPIPDTESYLKFQEFLVHYRNQRPDPSQIYPHAANLLENLHSGGVKLGICTNKQEASSLHLLKELGLKKYFTYTAGGDTFPVHKPNPGHITGVIKELEVSPDACLMVGDGPNDVVASHAAGIPCIVVTHGYSQDYDRLGADLLIADFLELPAAIEKLGFDLPVPSG